MDKLNQVFKGSNSSDAGENKDDDDGVGGVLVPVQLDSCNSQAFPKNEGISF